MKYYKYVDDIYDAPPLIYKIKSDEEYFQYFTKRDGWLQARRTWKSYVEWMKNDPVMKNIKLLEITKKEVFIQVL